MYRRARVLNRGSVTIQTRYDTYHRLVLTRNDIRVSIDKYQIHNPPLVEFDQPRLRNESIDHSTNIDFPRSCIIPDH